MGGVNAQMAPVLQTVDLPLGEWLPDLPALNNPGALEALNVFPANGCYVPFPQATLEESLPDICRGAFSIALPSGTRLLYAGTPGGLYARGGGGAFVNLKATVVEEKYAWQLLRVNDVMVAVHPQSVPQKSDIATVGAFIDVGGNPPKASCAGQVGDFLVLGNLTNDPDDGNLPYPSRIRWGGFNNIDQLWVSSTITQADFQDMPAEGGAVIAISGRQIGTIFQESMISRMRYVGPPNIFNIETVEDRRGCIARDSVVDFGAYQAFIANDGFFIWNGVNSSPIGDNKVNDYFFKRLNYNQRSRIVGAYDYATGCVVWAYPTTNAGTLDELIIWSSRENRWARSMQVVDWLLSSSTTSITMDELTGPLDSLTTPLDSPIYSAGAKPTLGCFVNGTFGLYNGAPMAAVLETAEYTAENLARVFVNDARPIVDLPLPVATMQAAARDQLQGEALAYSTETAQELDGRCPIVVDGRYMRFRVLIPANVAWKKALGVAITRTAGGQY